MNINASHAIEAFKCRQGWQVERKSRREIWVRREGDRYWRKLVAVTASGLFSIDQIKSLIASH